MCIDEEDNELEVLEIIHHYVEILDRYFGSVSSIKSFDFWRVLLLDLLVEYFPSFMKDIKISRVSVTW